MQEGAVGLKLFTKILGSAILIPSAVLGISSYENKTLKVENYQIKSARLPDAFDGWKLVFLSDLHAVSFGEENHKLIEQIERIHPDMIVVGGDMIIGKKDQSTEVAFHLLSHLAEHYPVVCANGNHEYRMKIYRDLYGVRYDCYVSDLRSSGVTYLENDSIKIQKNKEWIIITGLQIARRYYKRGAKTQMKSTYLDSVIGSKRKDQFQILLAHNPLYFPEYAKWGADLVLSGHNHGGLIRLPFLGGLVSPQMTFFPKYDAGYYRIGDSQMIISRGLGTHTFSIRVCNRPEISVIHLQSDKKEKAE